MSGRHPLRRYLRGLFQGRSVYVLASLLLLFVVYPLLSRLTGGLVLLELLLTLLLVSSVYSLQRHGRARVAALLAAPTLAAMWASLFVPSIAVGGTALALLAVFLFYLVAVTLERIFQAATVTLDTICSALSVYLLMGVIWACLYALVYLLGADAFVLPADELPGAADGLARRTRFYTFFYFSFVTLTTVGYGDVQPVSLAARSFANLEAVLGQFYLAVLVARLVAVIIPRARARE